MEQKTAQFQIQDMLPIALTLVVVGIGVSYGLNVLADIKGDLCDYTLDEVDGTCRSCSNEHVYNSTVNTCHQTTNASNTSAYVEQGTTEFNATGNAMTGVAKLPDKLPLIATVIVAAIIIGILVRYLFMRFS